MAKTAKPATRVHPFPMVVVLSTCFVFGTRAAEPPRIDHIELFQANQVTVHFDTEANRTYELQFQNPAALSMPHGPTCSSLPEFPFPTTTSSWTPGLIGRAFIV
jgi:hypothetical protein